MAIRVRKKDGSVYKLEELFEYRSLRENHISIQRNSYLRVSKNLRKNYLLWKDSGSEVLVCFSDEKVNDWNCCKLFSNQRYFSKLLSGMLGEGIFPLEKAENDVYKIAQPKK